MDEPSSSFLIVNEQASPESTSAARYASMESDDI